MSYFQKQVMFTVLAAMTVVYSPAELKMRPATILKIWDLKNNATVGTANTREKNNLYQVFINYSLLRSVTSENRQSQALIKLVTI